MVFKKKEDLSFKRKLYNFFSDPHIIMWIVLLLLLIPSYFYFDYVKVIFLRVVIVSFIIILVDFLHPIIFHGKRKYVDTLFGDHITKIKAFPVFIFSIFLLFYLSKGLEYLLGNYLNHNNLTPWAIIIWIIIMYIYYYFRGFRK